MLEKQPSENVLANLANEEENFEDWQGERPVAEYVDDNHQAKLMRNKKIAFVSILVLSILFVGMSFYQIGNALEVPFAKVPSNTSGSTVAATDDSVVPDEMSAEEKSALRAKDSDEDGITDFDEIFVYKTSAYLTDSDSDGITDPDEIKAGEDPNCPKGQECFRFDVDTLNSVAAATTTTSPGADVDITKLRQILVQSGKYTKEQIDLVDDATLLKAYQETMKTNPDLQAEAAAPAAETVPLNGTDLTAVQIRALLIEQGVDADVVNQVDDATLVQMYGEAVADAKTAGE
jgi:hypothetical protein